MTLFPEQNSEAARQAEDLWRVPIGAASPLWAAYGAFAGAGIAYWCMTRMFKPANLEAFVWRMPEWPGLPAAADLTPDLPTLPQIMAETLVAMQPEPQAPPSDPAIEPEAPEAILAEAGFEAANAASESVGEAAMAVSLAADDLTRLVGIGPSLATKLADLGVRTYADIASWTEDDVLKMDKALDLKGRASRDRWVEQARQFAAQ